MRTLFIGEDSGNHVNNFLWAYNVDTGTLARVLSCPAGAESTGLQAVDDINGFAYVMSNFQHPGDWEKGLHDKVKADLSPLIDKQYRNRRSALRWAISTACRHPRSGRDAPADPPPPTRPERHGWRRRTIHDRPRPPVIAVAGGQPPVLIQPPWRDGRGRPLGAPGAACLTQRGIVGGPDPRGDGVRSRPPRRRRNRDGGAALAEDPVLHAPVLARFRVGGRWAPAWPAATAAAAPVGRAVRPAARWRAAAGSAA